MEFVYLKIIGIIVVSAFQVSGSDTRSECVASFGSFGGDNPLGESSLGDRLGDAAEDLGGFEADEFEGGYEGDEFEGMGFGRGFGRFKRAIPGMPVISGKLSCPTGNRGSILIKRVNYGASAFPGSCHNIPFCQEVFEPGVEFATQCNGKSTCTLNTLQPKFLNCGRLSNYMKVEYECVDTWAAFEICEGVSTTVVGASVLITSPGYLGTSKVSNTESQMCECIIQSHDKADLYLDYLQTELANDGDQCPWEYVMIESKRNINQNGTDKHMQACGQQHIEGRWFEGTVRLTYASGGPMQKRGLLAKFTVDNIGNRPQIQLECGTGSPKGLKLRPRPAGAQSTNPNAASTPAFGPNGMPSLRMNFGQDFGDFGFGLGMMPGMPNLPSSVPSANGPQWTVKLAPDDSPLDDTPSLKVNIPIDNFINPAILSSNVPAEQPRQPAMLVPAQYPPQLPPQADPGTNQVEQPKGGPKRQGPKKSGAGMVVADDGADPAIQAETPVNQNQKNHSGSMVAVVFAGIGAVLIVGSVGIYVMHSYRKRRRIRRKEEQYAYNSSACSTYGKGWETAADDESIYATVAEVESHREGCVNPAVSGDLFGINNKGTESSFSASRDCQRVVNDKEHELKRHDEYSRIMRTGKSKSAQTSTEISVVEVHQSFNACDEKPGYAGTSDCHGGSVSASLEREASCNRCVSCNIERPPRRRDEQRGYDNNTGVLRNKT